MNLLENVLDNSGDVTEGEEAPRRGIPTKGPQRVKYMTNGQVRRAKEREVKRNRRKNIQHEHATYFANRFETMKERGRAKRAARLGTSEES